MNILVLGGTKFFGVPMVKALVGKGHRVTIATRGNYPDTFGDSVSRIKLDRTSAESLRENLSGRHFDVVIDKICYCSNDMKKLLDVMDCDRYIYMSTTAVYEPKHPDTREEEFDPADRELVWCDRPDFPYDVVKRHAETALWQNYRGDFVSVRYPFVIGEDDYTKRLIFYVEHIIKEQPMFIDNIDAQMGFIGSREAGEFIARLVESDLTGAVNGCNHGTVSVREILEYVESKTGKKAILSEGGDPAPYNGETDYSINVEKAESTGYKFTELKSWLWELVDRYIEITA